MGRKEATDIIVRKATSSINDSDFVRKLRNQDYIRNASWNKKEIAYFEHQRFWKDNHYYYSIIEYTNKPVGFVRVKEGELSIAILKGYWNKGIGSFVLRETIKQFPNIKAEVILNNSHSLTFFCKCGFIPVGFVLKVKGG